MKISIIITTFNRVDALCGLLGELDILISKLECQKILIVVVVDGSTDGTIDMLNERHPHVSIVEGTGDWWFTKSLNEGCKFAINSLNADYILTLNDDVRLSENYLNELLDEFFKLDKNSLLGTMSVDYETKSFITFAGTHLKRRWNGSSIPRIKYGTSFNKIENGKTHISGTLPTRSLMFSTFVYKQLNGFDETFPQYASDNDFVLRARKLGYCAYITSKCLVYEKTKLTGVGSPRTTKSLMTYIKSAFFNKYSPSYIPNTFRMSWRHKAKILFPFYAIITFLGTFKSFFKYR